MAKKVRHYNGQKRQTNNGQKGQTNNELQNATHKTKDPQHELHRKPGVNPRASHVTIRPWCYYKITKLHYQTVFYVN